MGRILSSGEPLFSSIGAGATKLKPLKSWWAFALGGIPGESEYTQIVHYNRCINIYIYLHKTGVLEPTKSVFLTVLRYCYHGGRSHCKNWATNCVAGACVCVCGFLFTFRCFSGELWVKAERVIRFACCRFKRGLELSPVEFLRRYKLKKKNQTPPRAGPSVWTYVKLKPRPLPGEPPSHPCAAGASQEHPAGS